MSRESVRDSACFDWAAQRLREAAQISRQQSSAVAVPARVRRTIARRNLDRRVALSNDRRGPSAQGKLNPIRGARSARYLTTARKEREPFFGK